MITLEEQIIDDIRRKNFGIGIDTGKLPQEVQEHIEYKKRFTDKVSNLIKDLYSSKLHFILELIQNADDNDYDSNFEPKLNIIIQRDKIIIQNNETGFNEKHIRALCSIGDTTKLNRTSGYIGEKGIGFKSVFLITDKPHIYSNGFRFKFEYNKEEPQSIIIPCWINEKPDFIKKDETNIILYLKDDVINNKDFYSGIEPKVLLFLKKLKGITIKDDINSRNSEMKLSRENGITRLDYNDEKTYWKIIKKFFPVNGINEDTRKQVKETEIRLAFPINADCTANTENKQNLFVYLPVRNYGFNFIIQADFLLLPERTDIHKDKLWNEKLIRDNISCVFLESVEIFKSDKNLNKSYYNYIPLIKEVEDPFFSIVVEQIYEKLRNTECILTELNNWRKPSDICLADNEEFKELIDNRDLLRFSDMEYISSKIVINDQERFSEILSNLGCKEVGIRDLFNWLTNTDWLKQRKDRWFIQLYTYLSKQYLTEEELEELKQLKIIKLENNRLKAISDGTVFFPLDNKNDDYGFEKEMPLVKKSIIKEADNKVRKFLKELGIVEPSPYEIIEKYVLTFCREKRNSINLNKDKKNLLGYIRYIKDNLEAYEKESEKKLNTSYSEKKDPLRQLKKDLLILVQENSTKAVCEHPENMYLSKDYGNENNLEDLFENIENIYFVHREYIKDISKEYSRKQKRNKKDVIELSKKGQNEINKWKDFFIKIGVNELPRVIFYDGDGENRKYPTEDEKRYKPAVRVKDWDLSDEFIELLDTCNLERNKHLLDILNKHWEEHFKNFIKMKYTYESYVGRSCREYNKDFDSTFIRDLRKKIKIPVTSGELINPLEIYLPENDINELLGDMVKYLAVELNQNLIKDIGINQTVNVEVVLRRLKQIINYNIHDRDLFVKLYTCLMNNYSDNIAEEFLSHKLIFIPGNIQIYFSIKEVLWKDVSRIFKKNRGYLETCYPELEMFFVNKLGVNRTPTPKDYADVLLDLSKKVHIDEEDEKVIINIYKELNECLDTENNKTLISKEEWWNNFIREPILWVESKKFYNINSEDLILVNDSQDYYELFVNKPGIHFLKLPENYYPQIKYFIDTACVRYISEEIKIKPVIDTKVYYEQKLTDKLHRCLGYIYRYIYQLENDIYKRFEKEGMLEKLKDFKCYSVEILNVDYILREEIVHYRKNVLYVDGNLYIETESLTDIDSLALELARVFKNPKGFGDFLSLLLAQESNEKIEKLLKIRKIGKISEFMTPGINECETDVEEQDFVLEYSERKTKNVPYCSPNQEVFTEREARYFDMAEENSIEKLNGSKKTIKEQVNVKNRSIIDRTGYLNLEEQISETERWYQECEPEEAKIHYNIYNKKNKKNIPVISKFDAPFVSNLDRKLIGKKDNSTYMDRNEIGRWGEAYVFKYLKEKMKCKYPGANYDEDGNSFFIRFNGEEKAIVKWFNKNGESGKPYDIEISMNNDKEYVEVKSTKTDGIEVFILSGNELEKAKELRDKFHIYRVYNAGKERLANIIDIKNPYSLLMEGNLEIVGCYIKL